MKKTPDSVETTTTRRFRLRSWAARLGLLLATLVVSLKVADIAVGYFLSVREHHLLRLMPRASFHHRSREFDYVFRTNSLGLRGPEYPFAKPPGVRRVIVVGDSFVAGYGVAEEHLLTVRLEDELNSPAAAPSGLGAKPVSRTEIVNVGRSGSSTVRELDLYEMLGRKFSPDIVILVYFYGNDLVEVLQEQTRTELAVWHPPGGLLRRSAYACCPNLYLQLALVRLSQRQVRDFDAKPEDEVLADIRRDAVARGRDADAAADAYVRLPESIRRHVVSGLLSEQRVIDSCVEPDRLVRALDPDDDFFQRAWGRTEEHLELLRQSVARDGARLIVAGIPAPVQIDPRSLEFHRELGYDLRDDWLTRRPRVAEALADWAQRSTVTFYDLTDDLRGADEDLYFIEDVHFTPAGNSRAAKLIAQFLRNSKLVE